MMDRFYLDTSGIYYLGGILEIVVLSESSGVQKSENYTRRVDNFHDKVVILSGLAGEKMVHEPDKKERTELKSGKYRENENSRGGRCYYYDRSESTYSQTNSTNG